MPIIFMLQKISPCLHEVTKDQGADKGNNEQTGKQSPPPLSSPQFPRLAPPFRHFPPIPPHFVAHCPTVSSPISPRFLCFASCLVSQIFLVWNLLTPAIFLGGK